jgi:hypothetical protein
LGKLSVDKTEIDQWKDTVKTGREQKGTHNLKPPQERFVELKGPLAAPAAGVEEDDEGLTAFAYLLEFN